LIPVEEKAVEKQEAAAGVAWEEAKNLAKRFETDRKKLEVEAGSREERVRKYKNQLLEIKNNDQFHAMQHQISATEDEIRKIEDEELELMGKYDEAIKDVAKVESSLKESKQRFQSQLQELSAKKQALQKQIDELAQKRKQSASEVDEDDLNRYERIFKSKQGLAIVRIVHGMCSGCNLKITAQEIHLAQHGDQFVSCTNCGRILYWDGE
jgi:predicted  nucleic acid-binding Zn-ribbon protein